MLAISLRYDCVDNAIYHGFFRQLRKAQEQEKWSRLVLFRNHEDQCLCRHCAATRCVFGCHLDLRKGCGEKPVKLFLMEGVSSYCARQSLVKEEVI